MNDSQRIGSPRIWISYPWINKEERDFAYLVTQLKNANIDAKYDSLQLLPNAHLWERTVHRLTSVGFDGWMYILTHQCFTRRTCTEELTAAIDQTLQHMGPEFPMIGLLHDISSQQVPPMLRVRPCISLSDPNWRQQISDILSRGSVQTNKAALREETCFIWTIHPNYGGNPSLTAVEVRSRKESIQYWRFAIPKSARATSWGQGASCGREISPLRFGEASGSARYGSHDVTWFGAANIISITESAYAVFSGPLPEFICFGPANSPFGPPGQMEVYWPGISGGAMPSVGGSRRIQ
jgi:hypothetical protein